MGLLKVIIAIIAGVLLDRFAKKLVKKHKDNAIVKQFKPYLDSSCYMVLGGVLLIVLIF